jgi:hypothetical protein
VFSNPKKILGFDDRLYVIAGIILDTQTVMAIYYTGAFFKVKFSDYVMSWLGEFFIVLILWFVIRGLYIEIAKRYRGFKNVKKRLLFIPFLLIPYVIICLVYLEYVQHIFKWDYSEFPEPGIPVQLATGAIILIASLGFYECIFLVLELKHIKLKEERQKKENLTTQLLNLKHQISPHFLFNSLNTLIYLIDTDKERSKEFVHRLSNVYERVLEFSDKNLISLAEELDYINAYIGLLEKRYGNNLKVDFNISEKAMQRMILPLSIQTGIENAVKHNVVSRNKPLQIEVRDSQDYLIIANNLQKKEITAHNNLGQGLKNIGNRYKLLSNLEMITEESDSGFILKLPLLEEEETKSEALERKTVL